MIHTNNGAFILMHPWCVRIYKKLTDVYNTPLICTLDRSHVVYDLVNTLTINEVCTPELINEHY